MKNTKKILGVGLVGAAMMMSLTGCGGGGVKESEWKAAYKDYIENVYATHPDVNGGTDAMMGTFVYIDDDDVPEMLLELPFTEQVVVTYKNGQAVAYNEPGATIYGSWVESYHEHDGVFLYKGTWETADTDYLVEITKDGFNDIGYGEIVKCDDDFNPLDDDVKPCTWNGTEVIGVTEYEDTMTADYDKTTGTKPTVDKDYDAIMAYLSE